MTYTEAIRMALSGDERGYTFLYEETYKSKMYLAIQYMKNEDDAMDILQDAYVKAFAKLDTLQDPEKFPSWFGMIVANTAKNALVKKNPVLFTDMAADPDAEPFEYSIEDENLSHQPELSYTSEETRLLVREMMDALSEEQRVCVLMFHIDGIPIKEIAETLGCSENTVKSRLNYARKNIKKQGEELQKKGYQLYEIAPFTLLLLLLHKDASAMSGEADFLAAGAKVEQAVLQNGASFAGESAASSAVGNAAYDGASGISAGTSATSSAAGNAAAGTAAKTAAGTAVKSAFLSTAVGKITVGVVGAVLIGGSVFGVSQVVQNNQDRNTSAVVQEADGTGTLSSETVPETVEGVMVETDSELETEWETMFETELLSAETEIETELIVETESEIETESETMAETESESETETELSTELQTEFLTEFETELLTETDTETESEIQTETETESESESETESETESESETETIAETESEDTAAVQAVSFDEFPDLLEGNLTKEELEFVLAHLRAGDPEFNNWEYPDGMGQYYIARFCLQENSPLETLGTDGDGFYYFDVSEVNRLFSVFTDYRITEENDQEPESTSNKSYDNFDVVGDIIWVIGGTFNYTSETSINAACVVGDTLVVSYDYHYVEYSRETEGEVLEDLTETHTAILEKDANNLYRIVYTEADYTVSDMYPELASVIETLSIKTDDTASETETGDLPETESETETEMQTESQTETESEQVLVIGADLDTESEAEAALTVQPMSGSELSQLVNGNPSIEELEFVLAYLPTYDWGPEDDMYLYFEEDGIYLGNTGSVMTYESRQFDLLNKFCFETNSPLQSISVDRNGVYTFSLDSINRLFAIFTDYRISEENQINVADGLFRSGRVTNSYTSTATITAAGMADDDLVLLFDYHRLTYDSYKKETIKAETSLNLAAVFRKNEDGMYQLFCYGYEDHQYTDYPEINEIIDVISGWKGTMDFETDAEADISSAVQTAEDDEYPDLLEGELTKEELEYVLAYVSDEMEEGELTDEKCLNLLYIFCSTYMDSYYPLTYLGYDSSYRGMYLVDGINRLFSVFTDYRITEENDSDSEYGVNVDGDTLYLIPGTMNYTATAAITEALYSDDEMIVYYDLAYEYDPEAEMRDSCEAKAAIFEKNANGNFQIVRITDAASVSTDELYASSGTEAGSEEIVMIIGEDTGSLSDTGMTDEIRVLYEQVLQDVVDGKYTFPSAAGCNIEGYYYFVTDMDSDGSPELVVGVRYTNDIDVFYWYDCLIFDAEAGSLVQINGDIELLSVFLPADGNCFYAETWIQRGISMTYIDQVTIQNGVLQSDSVYEMNIQDDAYTQFKESNPLVEWTEISDLTGLDNVQ
ncbi:MAG: RNA polymerase sigma factor [Clostridiales bacterium]|nr:RNA polymerase sigma factor [Clostridiales bacterium]